MARLTVSGKTRSMRQRRKRDVCQVYRCVARISSTWQVCHTVALILMLSITSHWHFSYRAIDVDSWKLLGSVIQLEANTDTLLQIYCQIYCQYALCWL